VDLSSLKGRRIKLRFLETGLRVAAEDYNEFGFPADDPRDDGWWIDDINIDETLSQPAILAADPQILRSCSNDPNEGCLVNADCASNLCNGPAPACGAACAGVNLVLESEPVSLSIPVPGQSVRLDLSGSTATRCTDGDLVYQFTNLDDPTDGRVFTGNPQFLTAPNFTSDYRLEVCCHPNDVADPVNCCDSQDIVVAVSCPGETLGFGFFDLRFTSEVGNNPNVIDIGPGASNENVAVDLLVGSLNTLRSSNGNFGTLGATIFETTAAANGQVNLATVGGIADDAPAAGVGTIFIVKKDGPCTANPDKDFCNSRTWNPPTSFAPGQVDGVGLEDVFRDDAAICTD
jgi:hypothetical protein